MESLVLMVDSMNQEEEFNRIASEELMREYEHETGHRLRLKEARKTFPDAILETSEGVELRVEFVSVVLPFVWQEEAYFGKYRDRLYEALRPDRPRYQTVGIRLQISSGVVDSLRPYKFPHVDGAEGRKLVAEFRNLLAQHLDVLRASYGHLIEDIASDAAQAFSTLLKYFNAIIVWDISKDHPCKPHPEDPVIEFPIVIYLEDELLEAVRRSLQTKARKGAAYQADFLVLHTLRTPGKPHFAETAMSACKVKALARELLTKEQELCQRFGEIWFLNAYWEDGHRLYRLK